MTYRIPFSVGLTSVAVIAFQLVIMQILSISQWHHFAYMVISMAMLGFGAAGTVLAIFRNWFTRHYEILLPLLYLLTGISMSATVWISGLFGDFDAFLLFFERAQIGLLIFTYLAYCLPFFFGGLAITLVFYQEVYRIGPLYFANMIGSGIGAILIIVLLWVAEVAVLSGILSLLAFAAAWLTRIKNAKFITGWAAALIIPLVSIINPAMPEPSEYKAIQNSLRLPGAEVVHRSPSPYGTIEVVEAEAQRFTPGLSLHFTEEPPVKKIMYNNGEYYGTLLGRGETETGDHILDYTTRAFPYSFRDPDRVLVVNASTGTDVSHAVSQGASKTVAVEPNNHANRLLTHHHPEWVDSLYLDDRVSLENTTPRSYLAGNPDARFDLIVMPVLGAFGGSAGVYAMQEQFHLTKEAFSEMWDLLDEDGMIAATSWMDYPLRPALKLPATWRKLLEEKGIENPEQHLTAIRSWGTTTFVLSKSPVSNSERDTIREFSSGLNFDPLLLEDLEEGERDRFNRIEDPSIFAYMDSVAYGDVENFINEYTFNLQPATDNQPFFSHFLEWQTIPELREFYGDGELPYMELGFVLAGVTFIQIVLASVILIILPLFRIGWQGTRRRWTFLYFAGLGIGFMFFEMVLIQQLVLYLGLPVYATALVLATLLIFSGTGSYFSSRFRADQKTTLRTGALIAALILLYTLFLMPVLNLTMGWPLILRVLFMFLLMAPPAFFMGMMFPFGLRRLSGSNESHIPWACGIDSCLSVSATALATLVALEAGFSIVMGTAAAAYGITALASLQLGSKN